MIVKTYDIMNFQNLVLASGFSKIWKPKTVSMMKSEIKLAFMMKLKTMAKMTSE
tara:strand:+ start:100 stop:261 length:162 start_codon:yes stop_codon:yes gene_type:complete